MSLAKLLLFLLPFHLLFKSVSECSDSFQCGDFSMRYPLTDNDPGCGLIMVAGCDSGYPYPAINFGCGGLGYTIMEKNSDNKFLVKYLKLESDNRSCFSLRNLSLLQSPSVSITVSPSFTFFPCFNQTISPEVEEHFHDYDSIYCGITSLYYKIPTNDSRAVRVHDIPQNCSLVQLLMKSGQNSGDLFNLLTAEFSLEWKVSQECLNCFNGGGQCLTSNDDEFYCKRGGMAIATLASTSTILFLFIRGKRAKARRLSIVSIGTIGYIAPEVFGDISYKSDVYSYGMLNLEMVRGRKNVDPRT